MGAGLSPVPADGAAYFALAARDLAPRLEAAAARGDLSCVFLTL